MNTFQKFQIAKAAILQAKEIIGLIDRPSDALDYGDFETPELRDLYYTLNDYWLTLHAMQHGKEVAPEEDSYPDVAPCSCPC